MFQRLWTNLNAVPGLLGQDVIATDDGDRIDEVFVEMVDIFDHSKETETHRK